MASQLVHVAALDLVALAAGACVGIYMLVYFSHAVPATMVLTQYLPKVIMQVAHLALGVCYKLYQWKGRENSYVCNYI